MIKTSAGNARCAVKALGCSAVADLDLMAVFRCASAGSHETEVREIPHRIAAKHRGDIPS